MASGKTTYRRLPGKKKGFIVGHHTLWKSSDHLLQIYSRMGVEDYKRFYFNDIQAIITRKTDAGKILNIVLGALMGLFGFLTAISGGGWLIFNAIIGGLMLVFFAANLFKGPTCETHLFTAVQKEKLHSLHRLNTAQPVMNELRLIIEQHQGRIDPDVVNQQPAGRSTRLLRGTTGVASQALPAALKAEKGKAHLLLFVLLVFDALIIAAGFLLTHVALTLLGTAVTMAMGICVVIALVKQHESSLKKSLRSMTWAALGYVGFSFLSGYIVSMGVAFKNPQIVQSQWELVKLISNITPWQSPLMMTVSIVALCAAALIGTAGLCMLKNPQRTNHNTSALTATPAPTVNPKRIS